MPEVTTPETPTIPETLKTKTDVLTYRIERSMEGTSVYVKSSLIEDFAKAHSSPTLSTDSSGNSVYRLDRCRDGLPSLFNSSADYLKVFYRKGLSEGITARLSYPVSASKAREIAEDVQMRARDLVQQYGRAVRISLTLTVDDAALRLPRE